MGRFLIHNVVKFDNKFFNCSTFALLEEKEELFYHFNYKEKKKVLNGGYFQDIESGIDDHVSFHKDGTIHITTKSIGSKTEHLKVNKLETNLFDTNTFGMFPFIIDSFCGLEKYRIIDNFIKEGNVAYSIWELVAFKPFSLISFLVRSVDASNGIEITTKEGTKRLCPPDMKQINMWIDNLGYRKWIYPDHISIFELFNGWNLLLAFSPFIIPNKNFNELNLNKEIMHTRGFAVLPPQDLSVTFMDKDNEKKLPSYQII